MNYQLNYENNNKKVILDNEYFEIYIENLNVYLNSKPKEIQEIYDSNDVMSFDEKIKRVDDMLSYFYNLWKLIEKNEENLETKTQYTLNIDISLVMISIPMSYYIKFKKILDSLKSVIITHLKETNVKINSKLAKYFFDIIFTFYTPIKPVNIISD